MREKLTAPRLWLSLAFVLMLILGLMTVNDYGVYCDQLSEQVILRENMKEYAVRFGDASAVAYYESLGVQRITESIEIDHGQCAYYPIAPALTLIQADSATLSFIWHGYTWLLFMLGCWALYLLLRQLELSRPIAFVGMLLLFLSPRFFAEGHYNNKDMVLLTFVLCTLCSGLYFLRKPGFLRGMLFSLVGAMAANTKIVGLVAWGLMGLCAVALISANHRWSWRMAGVAAATIAFFGLVYALLTPAMWDDPAAYFSYLLSNASGFTRWPGVVVFRGMVFDHQVNPLPRYYLPYMMLVTLPLYFFPLCAVGQLAVLRRCVKQRGQLLGDPKSLVLISATVLWVLFMGYVMIFRPLVYNGWRHFYFLFAGLVVLAAWGLDALWGWCAARGCAWRRAAAALGAVCLILTGIGMGVNHPYQYCYYNPLAANGAQERMELDYWDVSTVNAIRGLMTAQRATELPLVLGARDDMSWFGLNTGRTALTAEEQDAIQLVEDGEAPYLYVNTTYGIIYGVEAPKGYRILFEIESYGNVIGTVYERVV